MALFSGQSICSSGKAMQFLQRKASKITLWRFVSGKVLMLRGAMSGARLSDPNCAYVVVGDNTTSHGSKLCQKYPMWFSL